VWEEPVIGTEVIIEKAFMDVFCDLVYGSGWMDTKQEEADRECNRALVICLVYESHDRCINDFYRFTPAYQIDCFWRRTSTTFLFEELQYAPLEYRQ